jgi:hypothetical protein
VGTGSSDGSKLTFSQRVGLRQVGRKAGKSRDEPLSSEDWAAWARLEEIPINRAAHRLWRMLPTSPRCALDGKTERQSAYRVSV